MIGIGRWAKHNIYLLCIWHRRELCHIFFSFFYLHFYFFTVHLSLIPLRCHTICEHEHWKWAREGLNAVSPLFIAKFGFSFTIPAVFHFAFIDHRTIHSVYVANQSYSVNLLYFSFRSKNCLNWEFYLPKFLLISAFFSL